MLFEWDARKAAVNLVKHGVSFDEAATAFADPLGLDGEDIDHSSREPRRLRLARSLSGRLLVIAYTIRRRGHEEATRIISARRANRQERSAYEEKAD
jgi:uncharacterized DUF497 family protein